MQIYNSFSKKKEEFLPLQPPSVSFYVCGPTVYNYFHIGNARSFIMADIIRRYIEYKGYDVKFAMNLTDIDDKIINKSIEENRPSSEIALSYSNAFFNDLANLKVKPATINPRATEHIDEIIKMISDLESKGYAYNVDGNVFFDIKKFKEYGKLSGKNLDELEIGARIEVNESKKNPLDFSLWKKAKEGEPFWDSPWGKGRPGWHIECSAMSCKHLGKTIDIHAGGNDLIFPHHENEIAQSEAANDQTFVKYWLHFGFLNIQNEKMSKSLGNFFTAREVLKKYSAEAIRLFFAQTHYRGPLNFSDELLSSAERGADKIRNLAETIENELIKNNEQGEKPQFDIKNYYEEFEKVMDDDFNSPQAVAVIFDFIRQANKVISENENIHVGFYRELKEFLGKTAENVLGVIHFDSLSKTPKSNLDDKLIKLLLEIRLSLKKSKNFDLSDLIRDEMKKIGVTLKDGKEGTTYKIE